MSRWVLDFLKTKEDSIDSLKDELVPMLVSKQYTKMRNRSGFALGGTSFRGDESMDESQMGNALENMLSEISCHVYIHNGVCSRAMNMPSFVRLNDATLSGDFSAACGGSPGVALNTGLHRSDLRSSCIWLVPNLALSTTFTCLTIGSSVRTAALTGTFLQPLWTEISTTPKT